MKTPIILLFSLFLVSADDLHCPGYKFVDIFPNTEDNLKVVSAFGDGNYDVVRRARNVGQKATLFVNTDQVGKLTDTLKQNGLTYSIRDPNFAPINSTRSRRFVHPVSGNEKPSALYNMEQYQSFDEQMEYLKAAADDNPSFVSVGRLGKTWEGREMKYITIGYPSINSKPTLLIDAGIHAREWIASAVALWTIQELTNSNKYQDLLQKIDIVIVPNLNPDGYEYTRTGCRMWRKNRRTPSTNSSCYGVDLNRNFPLDFGGPSTSDDPCHEMQIFQGPYALSEPESHALSTYMMRNQGTIKAYLTLHSVGPQWVYPWGYARHTYPDDVQDLIDVANRARTAIASVRGSQYQTGSAADVVYPVGGASDDYAKSLGIKYVYTVEMSNHEESKSFEIPEQFILPTSQEVFQGILVVAETIAK